MTVWLQVLDVVAIGLDDTFISLGGDSIAAMRCINRLESTFACEIPFVIFLEAGMTARKLAAIIEDGRAHSLAEP